MMSLKDIFSFKAADDNTSAVVGIDIGSSSIKVVELQEKKGVLTLGTYGELQLGPYADKHLGESVVTTSKQEQEALIDIIRESAITAKRAVFAMPLSSSFVTNVSIEAASDADLSALVRVEARKVIPASLSEVTLDWAEVETAQEAKDAKDKKDDKAPVKHNILIAAIYPNQAAAD
jgi:Tfp pilus assembly PilM family ATPase